jgi:medium-chain acyl-[acyl-carrier-protein] hydrolase
MNRWLVRSRPVADPTVRIFLLPHAGGGASAFRGWSAAFPRYVELCAVQLPGRESRFMEPPFRRIHPLVEALADAIVPLLDRPFMVFGHSMGAILAYELVCCLHTRFGREPIDLIVSGHAAPRVFRRRDPPIHRLSDAELVDVLRSFGGTPQGVLASPDLLEAQLPTVRADFEAYESWTPVADAMVTCPILAISGRDDTFVTDKALEAWRYETTGPFDFLRLPGDHFYTGASRRLLFSLILARLTSALGRRTAPQPNSG